MDSARATMKELSFGIFDRIERTSGSPNLEEPWGSLTAAQNPPPLRPLRHQDYARVYEGPGSRGPLSWVVTCQSPGALHEGND